MKNINIATLLLTLATNVYGQTGQTEMRVGIKDRQELLQLRQTFFDAQKQGNRFVLEQVLADSFYFVHSTGVVEKKKGFIDRIVSQATRRPEIEFVDDQLTVYENGTVVWLTRSVIRSPEGTETNFRATDVLVKTKNQWQWVSVHSTKLPSRPRPYTLSADTLKSYIGDYEINANRSLTVKEDMGILIGRSIGIRQQELIPVSPTEFIWFSPDSNVDMRISFIRDSSGRIIYAVLHSDGKEVWRAKKLN